MKTSTFTFHEKEKNSASYLIHDYVDIHYCSYCGSKAIREDIGSSHNHRWEEDIIYYCNCDVAKREMELNSQISKLNSQIYTADRELNKLKELENNEIVNKLKYDFELNRLKDKYKIQ